MKQKIAVAKGDGIGSEIMDAVINIFNKVGVPLEYNFIEMGRETFLKGFKLGMTEEAKQTVETLGILFKGPMETPKGGGNRSINVTARKMWGTFANCRRFKTLPGVETIYSKAGIPIDLTIIRENLEDTYGGIEHLIASDLGISRKLASMVGAEQINRYAFEYAKQQGLTEVVCGHKANIMKITDGLFLEVFYEIAKEYPEIIAKDVIVDDLCMKLVTVPNKFQVVVLPNLQGDIVSDLCAGLVGGLGFAPSANIGNNINIFEAVHGTAPDITGKNVANPTALLMSGLMMLNYLGLGYYAQKIEIAMLEALKAGIHTPDLKSANKPVSTVEYANAIIEKALAVKDSDIKHITNNKPITIKGAKKPNGNVPVMLETKEVASTCVGIDLFIASNETPNVLASNVNKLLESFKDFKIEVITNRGTAVYPVGSKFTECVTNYTVRFFYQKDNMPEIEGLKLATYIATKYKLLSLEFLRKYGDKLGFSVF